MNTDRMPLWQRLVAAISLLAGVVIADPVGHALARPTDVGGPAGPIAVPVLTLILLLVGIAMAMVGPLMAYSPRPLHWVEWLAALLTGLTFAVSGLTIFWLGAPGPEFRPALGVAIIHLTSWLYVLQWRKYAVAAGVPANETVPE